MNKAPTPTLEESLEQVRDLMVSTLAGTALGRLKTDLRAMLGNGKMLRSRMIFHLGPAARVPHATLLHAAAAVEMIHAASLLHDDVIDGGQIRRGAPTFWVERGVPGAILVGDLILFKAIELVCRVESGRLVPSFVQLCGEVCDAESEQELLLRGEAAQWEDCVRIARRKTGALFAFAAYACGGEDAALGAILQESGFAVGTAYQLVDDLLDASGRPEVAGKSLGSDEARRKTTAVSASQDGGIDPVAYVEMLCEQAERALDPWPDLKHAWRQFMAADMRPTLSRHLAVTAK